jgi:large conductance mechanosensitive channel
MFKEFREFAMRGNVIDMAVGIVIGVAFGGIVNSFVSDIIMPPIGMLLGDVDFSALFIILKEGKVAGPYESLDAARAAGAVTVNYGLFVNTIISFLIIACAIFVLVRKVNSLKKKEEKTVVAPTTKECPYCMSVIPMKAVRCPYCTSEFKT